MDWWRGRLEWCRRWAGEGHSLGLRGRSRQRSREVEAVSRAEGEVGDGLDHNHAVIHSIGQDSASWRSAIIRNTLEAEEERGSAEAGKGLVYQLAAPWCPVVPAAFHGRVEGRIHRCC
jgi:hypothetical protein